jgi:hypothetical protein
MKWPLQARNERSARHPRHPSRFQADERREISSRSFVGAAMLDDGRGNPAVRFQARPEHQRTGHAHGHARRPFRGFPTVPAPDYTFWGELARGFMCQTVSQHEDSPWHGPFEK